ncbi:hypothetical protein, partial [Salmonella enterica]|uniref:hypothetical protein n=1 Tax=Salmonella enterica TaxID=28901 RepID=UPI003F8F0F37
FFFVFFCFSFSGLAPAAFKVIFPSGVVWCFLTFDFYMALLRCFHCPEESQNFPFRGYGFKDPAPAFKGEVSSGYPPQSFPGMPPYTPSPYSTPDLGVYIIKCFFRHDVSVIGSPSPDHRVSRAFPFPFRGRGIGFNFFFFFSEE